MLLIYSNASALHAEFYNDYIESVVIVVIISTN